MLNTLSHLDRKAADDALASAVLAIGNAEYRVLHSQLSNVTTELLNEARTRLRIPEGDSSPRSLNEIRSFLSKEVTRRLMEGFDKKTVIDRLGNSGSLPIGGYKIVGSDNLVANGENFKFAEHCVRTADSFSHLETDDSGFEKRFSIFIKRVKGTAGLHYAIVTAIRDGDKLTLGFLWRAFPEVVALSEAITPLRMLEVFAEHYGYELRINDKPSGKKFLHHKLLEKHEAFNGIGYASPNNVESVLVSTMEMHDNGTLDVRYAYAVNLQRYRADKTRYM